MIEDDYFLGTKLYHKMFTDLCKPIIDYMGVTSAQYVNIDKHGRSFVVYSLKKWGERVIEQKHYNVETVLVHPDNMHNGFSVCDSSQDLEYKNTLLYDGAVNFNWWHACCYIEKNSTNDGFFGLGFATTKDNFQMINILVNQTHLIKNMIRKLHREMSSIKDLEDNRADLSILKKEAFRSQQGLIFYDKNYTQSKIDILSNIYLTKAEDRDILINPHLSPQEINCLRMYMTTHSIKKVSKELHLEPTTVTSYIENIKDKLACNNKQELLEKSKILETLGHI